MSDFLGGLMSGLTETPNGAEGKEESKMFLSLTQNFANKIILLVYIVYAIWKSKYCELK